MFRRHATPMSCVAVLLLFLAACAGGGGSYTGTNLPPTATPIPPTPTPNVGLVSASTAAITIPSSMASLSLGSYQAASVAATQGGLILAGAPTGSTISNNAGFLSLAYLDFKSHTPQTIATATTATDKVARGITSFVTGGDWVAYVQQGQQGQDWELWAVNATTGTKQAIDSALKEQGIGLLPNSFATDGTDVVWATAVAGQTTALLRAYDLTTNTVRTLVTLPAGSFTDITLVNRLLFYQSVAPITNVGTSWLWLLTQPQPTTITAQPLGTVALNSHYLIWYDADPQMLDLYDIVAGKTQQVAAAPCVNPIIAQDRPFIACLDDVDDQYQVIRTPSGTSAPFGLHATGGFGTISNDRVYWVPEPNPLSSNNVVDYFDLPKS